MEEKIYKYDTRISLESFLRMCEEDYHNDFVKMQAITELCKKYEINPRDFLLLKLNEKIKNIEFYLDELSKR